MEKIIPYEKLSKKEKRKLDLAKRQTWGDLNPVTRKPENSKAYNRRKAQNWKKELPNSVPLSFLHLVQNFFCIFVQILRNSLFQNTAFGAGQNRHHFPFFSQELLLEIPQHDAVPDLFGCGRGANMRV